MSFQPVVAFTGLAGWAQLKRTSAEQMQRFAASGAMARDADYFRAHIGSVSTAADLVADRRLLSVALGAFGLEGDISNRYFIRKVLEDGTLSPDAIANKLSDKRYLKLSKAFGFGDFATPRTKLSDFADGMLASYRTASFEAAIGKQSSELRLALNAERELPGIASGKGSENGKWYAIMGSAPLRQMFQTAFGLPQPFVRLPLDQQLSTFKAASERYLGTGNPAALGSDETRERLIRLFLARSESSPTSSDLAGRNAALTLLSGSAKSGLSRLI
ncbi:MAG TPA: DUF1217 domain-containing protein [Albidovulum sp.]|uniref:DUF1217 domain-containing protein n=1 Tax=Albidovulum sp. TaxID=1872424 RepID=UPI002D0F280D|nr:DUF1217 domain-containing protein [Albidovulum sp.]